MYRTLVDVGTLAARLHDPTWIVLDCRFDLGKPSWGETAYATGHIENARYLHLERDLSSPATASTGRHPLPDPDTFAARAGALGVGPDTQVVVYDQGNGMYASRAWWVLRWLGHADVAVLSGGLAAWTAAGHALTAATPAIMPRVFHAAPDAALIASKGVPEEKALATLLEGAAARAQSAVASEDFAGAMRALAELRPAVDAFFDKVTVNDADPALRLNRLKLLSGLRRATRAVADFGAIAG